MLIKFPVSSFDFNIFHLRVNNWFIHNNWQFLYNFYTLFKGFWAVPFNLHGFLLICKTSKFYLELGVLKLCVPKNSLLQVSTKHLRLPFWCKMLCWLILRVEWPTSTKRAAWFGLRDQSHSTKLIIVGPSAGQVIILFVLSSV